MAGCAKYFDKEPQIEDYRIFRLNGKNILLLIINFAVLCIICSLFKTLWLGFVICSFFIGIQIIRIYSYFNDKELYKEQILRQAKEYWFSMDGRTFEKQLAKLFNTLGYKTTVTKGSGDGGVDIILENSGRITYVQCKAYKHPAGPAPIRELFGVLKSDKVNEGIVACLAGFTKGARDFAFKNDIKLMDINNIIKISSNKAFC